MKKYSNSFRKNGNCFESITAQNARRAALKNQKSSIQAQLQSLAMWKEIPFELEAEGTKTMLFTFGTLDFRTDLAQLKSRLDGITSANLFASVNQDDHYQYCYLVYPKDYARECDLCLKEAGWNRAAFANLTGTVPENMEKCKKKAAGHRGRTAENRSIFQRMRQKSR